MPPLERQRKDSPEILSNTLTITTIPYLLSVSPFSVGSSYKDTGQWPHTQTSPTSVPQPRHGPKAPQFKTWSWHVI